MKRFDDGQSEYADALMVAGAEVHCFKSFGSWQGDWWAKVTYNGQTGWVNDYFGSCTSCDAFQREFNCETHHHGEKQYCPLYSWCDEYLQFDATCKTCHELEERLKKFAGDYLEHILTYEQAIALASEDLEWDMDAKDMVDFIESNRDVTEVV